MEGLHGDVKADWRQRERQDLGVSFYLDQWVEGLRVLWAGAGLVSLTKEWVLVSSVEVYRH